MPFLSLEFKEQSRQRQITKWHKQPYYVIATHKEDVRALKGIQEVSLRGSGRRPFRDQTGQVTGWEKVWLFERWHSARSSSDTDGPEMSHDPGEVGHSQNSNRFWSLESKVIEIL